MKNAMFGFVRAMLAIAVAAVVADAGAGPTAFEADRFNPRGSVTR